MKFTKETLKRALRTFLQAALAYIATVFLSGEIDIDNISKTLITGILMSAIAAGAAAVMNLQREELGAGGLMTFDEWVKKYLGKGTDYDGAYGVQCVDLAKLFIDKVLGITPQSIGNAIDYYNKRNSTYLKNNFIWIGNTPDFVPQRGDLAVFTSRSGVGHISVCSGEGDTHSFYSYDQNYPGGKHEPMTRIKHTYNSLIGVLRPKNQEMLRISNKPKVKAGAKVVFTKNRKCYKGYGAASDVYKISELTSFACDDTAIIRKGAAVTVKAVGTLSNGNIWIEYEHNNHKAYSCIYEKATDNKLIK